MSFNEEQTKTFSKEKESPFCPNLEKGIGRDKIYHIESLMWIFVLLSVIASFSNRSKKQERRVKIIGTFQNTTARLFNYNHFFLRRKLKKTVTAGKRWFSAHPVTWHHLISQRFVSVTKHVNIACIQNWYSNNGKERLMGLILELNYIYGQSNPVSSAKEKKEVLIEQSW